MSALRRLALQRVLLSRARISGANDRAAAFRVYYGLIVAREGRVTLSRLLAVLLLVLLAGLPCLAQSTPDTPAPTQSGSEIRNLSRQPVPAQPESRIRNRRKKRRRRSNGASFSIASARSANGSLHSPTTD